jgi:hypothetical protein
MFGLESGGVISHSATPLKMKQIAVFAFIETQIGKMLFSTAISKVQPISTMPPTITTSSAASDMYWFARMFEVERLSGDMCELHWARTTSSLRRQFLL